MTKEQKIKALEKLKEEYRKGFCSGLCKAVSSLWLYREINYQERAYLHKMLEKERIRRWEKGRVSLYFWEMGAIAPRTRWINQQIKKLEGE